MINVRRTPNIVLVIIQAPILEVTGLIGLWMQGL